MRTVKHILLNKVLLVLLVASACSGSTITQNNPAATPTPAPKNESRVDDAEFARIAAKAQGRVGFAARVLETGAAFGLNTGEHYPMHSVYKLPTSMAVLRHVDAGDLKLDQDVDIKQSELAAPGLGSPLRNQNPNGGRFTVAELLRYVIVQSD